MQKNNDKLKQRKLKEQSRLRSGRKSELDPIDCNDEGSDELDEVTMETSDEPPTDGRKQTRSNGKPTYTISDPAVEGEGMASVQDQGYTRPRILILCPFRSSARRLIRSLIFALGEDLTSVAGMDKFEEEYGTPDDTDNDENQNRNKPADWRELFDDNTDDDFKMGIQLTPGQGKGSGVGKGSLLRLYSDFYLSDIIIASPLGLRLVVEAQNSSSFDFISSIEITFLHQADVLYNLMPTSNHDTDFSRVRPYFLDGKSSQHSQLIVTSKFSDPLIWNVFRKYGRSHVGHIRFKASWGPEGCLGEVTSRVKQVFQIIPCPAPTNLESTRFEYFKKNILGPVLRLNQSRTLIVTPSYISYVKVRNELIRLQVQEQLDKYYCLYQLN